MSTQAALALVLTVWACGLLLIAGVCAMAADLEDPDPDHDWLADPRGEQED